MIFGIIFAFFGNSFILLNKNLAGWKIYGYPRSAPDLVPSDRHASPRGQTSLPVSDSQQRAALIAAFSPMASSPAVVSTLSCSPRHDECSGGVGLAGDEPELACRRPPWHGGVVRRGLAISGGHSGRSKGTRASWLRGECGALQHGVNEAVERRVHDCRVEMAD
jgi:hypothetical protein